KAKTRLRPLVHPRWTSGRGRARGPAEGEAAHPNCRHCHSHGRGAAPPGAQARDVRPRGAPHEAEEAEGAGNDPAVAITVDWNHWRMTWGRRPLHLVAISAAMRGMILFGTPTSSIAAIAPVIIVPVRRRWRLIAAISGRAAAVDWDHWR